MCLSVILLLSATLWLRIVRILIPLSTGGLPIAAMRQFPPCRAHLGLQFFVFVIMLRFCNFHDQLTSNAPNHSIRCSGASDMGKSLRSSLFSLASTLFFSLSSLFRCILTAELGTSILSSWLLLQILLLLLPVHSIHHTSQQINLKCLLLLHPNTNISSPHSLQLQQMKENVLVLISMRSSLNIRFS